MTPSRFAALLAASVLLAASPALAASFSPSRSPSSAGAAAAAAAAPTGRPITVRSLDELRDLAQVCLKLGFRRWPCHRG